MIAGIGGAVAVKNQRIIIGDPGIFQCSAVAGKAIFATGILQRCIGDERDLSVAQTDEMVDRLFGSFAIVDIDRRDVGVIDAPLQDDGRVRVEKVNDLLIFGERPETSNHLPVLRNKVVKLFLSSSGDGFEDHVITVFASHLADAAHHFRKETGQHRPCPVPAG